MKPWQADWLACKWDKNLRAFSSDKQSPASPLASRGTMTLTISFGVYLHVSRFLGFQMQALSVVYNEYLILSPPCHPPSIASFLFFLILPVYIDHNLEIGQKFYCLHNYANIFSAKACN